MTIEGAVVREQGVTFAIVIVKEFVLRSTADAQRAIATFSQAFPGMAIILMAQNLRGTPTYYGRQDIVNFLAKISPARIPWRRYTVPL